MINYRFLHDVEEYGRYLKSRSAESLRIYFGYAIGSEAIDRLTETMRHSPELHDVFVAENADLEIVGTVHIARLSADSVELGFMVHEQYRNQGIANAMMSQVLDWARNRGYTGIYMHCISYNRPILKLVEKYGLEISRDHDEADARVVLPSANWVTLQREFVKQTAGIYTHKLLEHLRIFRNAFNFTA